MECSICERHFDINDLTYYDDSDEYVCVICELGIPNDDSRIKLFLVKVVVGGG